MITITFLLQCYLLCLFLVLFPLCWCQKGEKKYRYRYRSRLCHRPVNCIHWGGVSWTSQLHTLRGSKTQGSRLVFTFIYYFVIIKKGEIVRSSFNDANNMHMQEINYKESRRYYKTAGVDPWLRKEINQQRLQYNQQIWTPKERTRKIGKNPISQSISKEYRPAAMERIKQA